jgi:hypothetical protein
VEAESAPPQLIYFVVMSTDDREESAPPPPLPPPPLPPVAAGVDRQNEVVWLPDGYPLALPPGLTDEAKEANARDERWSL